MYKIIDTQGDLMKKETFKTKAAVIKRLADFHDIDFTNTYYSGIEKSEIEYKNIYEWLNTMKDDDERLNELLEWGQWGLEDTTINNK